MRPDHRPTIPSAHELRAGSGAKSVAAWWPMHGFDRAGGRTSWDGPSPPAALLAARAARRVAGILLAGTLGCRGAAEPSVDAAPDPAALESIARLESGDVPGRVAVTHAGVGTARALSDGPRDAAAQALVRMEAGESVLDAAIAGTRTLEDDPRFNAGTGANIRLDGATIQMDASLMVDDGSFAAVAVIERVANPILVARHVLDSPHVVLAGDGATRFAHRAGFEDIVPISSAAKKAHDRRIDRVRRQLASGKGPDWRALWNFPGPVPSALVEPEDSETAAAPAEARSAESRSTDDRRGESEGANASDTVGTVVRDGEARFAATLSTGGTSVTLDGRVGDVPIYGAGLFAGPAGAVACTGKGEAIIRESLARSVYEALERGVDVRRAVHEAVASFPEGAAVGIIAVDRQGWAVGANADMAYGVAP